MIRTAIRREETYTSFRRVITFVGTPNQVHVFDIYRFSADDLSTDRETVCSALTCELQYKRCAEGCAHRGLVEAACLIVLALPLFRGPLYFVVSRFLDPGPWLTHLPTSIVCTLHSLGEGGGGGSCTCISVSICCSSTKWLGSARSRGSAHLSASRVRHVAAMRSLPRSLQVGTAIHCRNGCAWEVSHTECLLKCL